MSNNPIPMFDLSELEILPEEPAITRYVIVVADADGKSYWRRVKQPGCYPKDDFVSIDTTLPIAAKGRKLPTLYPTPKGARQRVSDLYKRHKDGGVGLNCWIQRWERKESETVWHAREGFK
jgi:hypothetical protein